jgi:hypothetical protein
MWDFNVNIINIIVGLTFACDVKKPLFEIVINKLPSMSKSISLGFVFILIFVLLMTYYDKLTSLFIFL